MVSTVAARLGRCLQSDARPNDAQKTMGIIAGALVTGGFLQMQNGELPIPFWVVLCAHAAIGLGTLSGGWRIIHTMGSKITKLHPEGGFAAETGAAVAIYTATALGIGISTTHTITGAIVGVGATRRWSAVRWVWPDRSSGRG